MFARFGKRQVVHQRAPADDPAATPSTPPTPPSPFDAAAEESAAGRTHSPTTKTQTATLWSRRLSEEVSAGAGKADLR